MSVLDEIKNYMEMLKGFGLESFEYSYTESEIDSIGRIDEDARNCSLCSDKLFPFSPESYPDRIKVLFVVSHPANINEKRIFFKEERLLFSRILKAMNLDVSDIFVLPAIRCFFDPAWSIKTANFERLKCREFLKRSIDSLTPDLICFMGEETRLLFSDLKPDISCSRIFFSPSPGEMVKDPSLKKEAWEVFQNMMKELG